MHAFYTADGGVLKGVTSAPPLERNMLEARRVHLVYSSVNWRLFYLLLFFFIAIGRRYSQITRLHANILADVKGVKTQGTVATAHPSCILIQLCLS